MEVEKEIWRNISGYQGYQVSNLGRVKSIERKVKNRYGYRTVIERILKPVKDKVGYLQVNLWEDGKMKHFYVHRLVASAFVQNNSIFNTEINHKNEIKSDNRAENLEWCDRQYNNNFGTRNEMAGKSISKAKKGVYNTKISKPVKCLETGVIYPSSIEIKRKFGFAYQSICACCRGEIKTAYKFHWKWAD